MLQSKPYISSSPDALSSCDCCSDGIVEIKCPYKYRHGLKSDDPAFFLDKNFCLKKSHSYYTQVQIQLLCASRKFCDFVTYTPSEIKINRIYADKSFIDSCVMKIDCIFENIILPELILREVPRSERFKFCKCRNSFCGEFLMCIKETCKIKYFHSQCIKNPTIPFTCAECDL